MHTHVQPSPVSAGTKASLPNWPVTPPVIVPDSRSTTWKLSVQTPSRPCRIVEPLRVTAGNGVTSGNGLVNDGVGVGARDAFGSGVGVAKYEMSRFGRAFSRGPIQPTPMIPVEIASTTAIPIQRPRCGPPPDPDPPIRTGRTLYPSSRRSVIASTYIADRGRVRVRLY